MKKAVVFLEPKGTILEVVRIAKEQGFHVVALSSDKSLLENLPTPYASAVSLIDEIISVKDWRDDAAVFSICATIHNNTSIAGVYAGMDPCAAILSKLRVKYGLPTHDPVDVETVLDKFLLRKKLQEFGLSRIQSYSGRDVDKWDSWAIQGAAYFKPVHGFFSAYVRRCENMNDLKRSQDEWREGSTNDPHYVRNYLLTSNEYHLEEAFDGELLSVEAISSNGNFQVLGLLSRILYSKDSVVEMGSCFPYPHPHAEKIISVVKKAHEVLGLKDGPTHTEVIVNQHGEVEIIDLNPRFVGADVLQSINHAFGIRIQSELLNYALGRDLVLPLQTKEYSCLQYFLCPEIERLDSVSFPNHPEVRFHAIFMKPGSVISTTNKQLDYLGCYLTVMPTFEQAITRSKKLRADVKVNSNYEGIY